MSLPARLWRRVKLLAARQPNLSHLRYVDQATEADILPAYRFFLRRIPEPQGYAHWRFRISQGLTLEQLINLFTSTSEYQDRQDQTSGIIPVDLGEYVVFVQASDPDIGAGILATHDYEPRIRRLMADCIKPGQTVLDVGANVGGLAFHAARLVGPTGLVVAVEPNPSNIQLLYRGIVQNQLAQVRVLAFAASDRPAILRLTGGVSNTFVLPAASSGAVEQYVQAIVLDEELHNLPALDFIKLDIEGHEPFALRGMSDLIRRHRPTLLTEFNPFCLRQHANVEPTDYARQLLDLYPQLNIFDILGGSAVLHRAEDVVAYFEKHNADAVRQGRLAENTFYLDILCRPA